MEYRALFVGVGKSIPENFRDSLTATQNTFLSTAERIAEQAIRDGMERGLPYKDVFLLAKGNVERFVRTIWPTLPGDDRPMLMEVNP